MKLDLNNLYVAWFNIMTQQKVVVNLAFKYTHEVCVQNHTNYLKLHYFPRHTWVTPEKINTTVRGCLPVGRSKIPKSFLTSLNLSFFDWFGRYASVVELFAQSHVLCSLHLGSDCFFQEKWLILHKKSKF